MHDVASLSGAEPFDLDRRILGHNLYGVDLIDKAIEMPVEPVDQDRPAQQADLIAKTVLRHIEIVSSAPPNVGNSSETACTFEFTWDTIMEC